MANRRSGRCELCAGRLNANGKPAYSGGSDPPCRGCGRRGRKQSSATAHLLRFHPGDPRAREFGRRGAEVTNSRRADGRRWFAAALGPYVYERRELMMRAYFSVLDWEPDVSWSTSVKVAELILDRLEGCPKSPSRSRNSDTADHVFLR
jgi:hypothetical protein